jgi:hypothetical protein
MYELDSGHVFAAYELYISAQLYNSAHNLALLELAPDAVIRKDLELLRSLFTPFDSDGRRDKIEGWFVRGKVISFPPVYYMRDIYSINSIDHSRLCRDHDSTSQVVGRHYC